MEKNAGKIMITIDKPREERQLLLVWAYGRWIECGIATDPSIMNSTFTQGQIYQPYAWLLAAEKQWKSTFPYNCFRKSTKMRRLHSGWEVVH